MTILRVSNHAIQTTAAPVPVATSAVIKTMLQVQASATVPFRIAGWTISFDGFAAALPGRVELIETTVAATVTASVLADITKVNGAALMAGNITTNLIQVGTGATGYNASAEGAVTTVRNLDAPIFLPPTGPFKWMFDNPPLVQVGLFARIRVTFGTSVNCYCSLLIMP